MSFKTFKQKLINETISVDNVSTKIGSTNVAVVQGRFQPVTAGHLKAFEQAKKTGNKVVIVLVKGEGSSQNKEKNPLPEKVQIDLIKKAGYGVVSDVVIVKDGFIGTMVDTLRSMDYEPKALMTGSDRLKTYESQIKKYSTAWKTDMVVHEIKRTGEDISATKVRETIKNNDYNSFSKLTKNLDQKDFEMLKKYIK
jgi:cytidyltransferase-like protein